MGFIKRLLGIKEYFDNEFPIHLSSYGVLFVSGAAEIGKRNILTQMKRFDEKLDIITEDNGNIIELIKKNIEAEIPTALNLPAETTKTLSKAVVSQRLCSVAIIIVDNEFKHELRELLV